MTTPPVPPAESPSLAPVADPPYGVAPNGYRLPAATRLGRVRLQVADLARSLAYYEGVLGLRALARAPGRAELGAGEPGARGGRVFVELVERPGARPVPRRGRLGLYHFALLLPDRAALGRLVAHLAASHTPAGASDHRVSEALYLTDPDGLGIEVYADRPRDTWQAVPTAAGRELAMATAPLDLAALVRAAEAAPGGPAWTGLPAGTAMGHVHLHVGDLAGAAAFYHEALGFDRVVWGYPGALFLAAGGYHHHLGTNTWAAAQPPAGDDDARLLEWTVELPGAADVDAAAASVAGAGYAAARDGGDLVARDPWGTAVRVQASAG